MAEVIYSSVCIWFCKGIPAIWAFCYTLPDRRMEEFYRWGNFRWQLFWVKRWMRRLVDLHWVRALMVPMHLGLLDGPFVPHNLISAQESPVPLPKFQVTPRFKILMPSGSKKGTQIYYPFLSKVLQANPLQVPQWGPYRKKPISRAFLNISSRVPSKGAFPRGSLHWASSERNTPFLEAIHPSLEVPGRWTPFQVPHWGPYGKICPSPEPFLPILQGPQQGSPPSRFPLQSSHRQRCSTSRAYFSHLSKVHSRGAHARLPNWAPMKKDIHLQSLPLNPESPVKETSLEVLCS